MPNFIKKNNTRIGIQLSERHHSHVCRTFFAFLFFWNYSKEKHTYLMASSISHTVFMYHFNEYFYRKSINLRSLAERNNNNRKKNKHIINSMSSSSSSRSICCFFFCLFRIMFGAVIRYLSVFFLLPNDHMLGSEHFDQFLLSRSA